MANNKTSENNKKSVEKDLQAQFEKLRSDISNATSKLTNLGANKLHQTKHKTEKLYNSAKENSEEIISQAKDKISNFEEALSRCVCKNPNKSVLVAAGIGFILAQLFRR
ncbi:DUF883 family protein [Bartonella sp. B41]